MRAPGRDDPGTQDDDEHARIYHPAPTVEPPSTVDVDVEPNPIVATLLGPRGEILVELRARPTIPFGFQKNPPRNC
jgi:hypothetical protein